MKSITWLGRLLAGIVLGASASVSAQIYNLKVVTDASPDYSDLPSLVHSITSKWSTPEEKCWAVFYWNHIARRQTAPMLLHGLELTDPIRQFNDYGYTMCSTISGINCGIWQAMGLKAKFWDISLHTVPEVFYDGRWHMYDNSMSALYTLCDGHTLAGVADIGQPGACEAAGGVNEPGHIAKYHCLYSTGPNGFLTGADTQRSLDEESRCFNPNGLKYRTYYYNWDSGHRYILNLRPDEVYTRYYARRGTGPEFYVPNNGKDPDDRYRIRGNGAWLYQPNLTDPKATNLLYLARNVVAGQGGLKLLENGKAGEVIFKVQAANVITSQQIKARFSCDAVGEAPFLSISTNNGLSWSEVWKAANGLAANVKLVEAVNGAYEVLIKAALPGGGAGQGTALNHFSAETTTMVNAKTQPRLNLGRNTIYAGAGEQTDSIVFWPELQGDKYKQYIVEEKNIASTRKHPEYQGTLYPAKAAEDACLVYRMDAPEDLTRVTFGGRFYNRAPKSHIDLLYSLDTGNTWSNCWSLRDTAEPWDVVHYETLEVPKGHRSILLKYLMNSREASPGGCSIYAVRMEADHEPLEKLALPIQVTFAWSEVQADRGLISRKHTQTVEKLPFKYVINVGGVDHPVVSSLQVNLKGAAGDLKDGYSDGRDVGGRKFIGKKEFLGKNVAIGKKYTLSKPSGSNWGAGHDGKKLTSGAGGPSYAGGTSYRSGALWMEKANPVITVDLGENASCASFGLNLHGYPWWDALKGEVQDKIEVLTSSDGNDYTSRGFLKTDMRWVDLPVNYMWTDEETMTSATFRRVPPQPVNARYVRYQITNQRIVDCAGIEVLDAYREEPFDLRVALPGE